MLIFITVTKIPDKNNLEEERFILAHSSRGSVHGWLTPCSGVKVSQNIVVEGHSGEKQLTSWQPGRREKWREQGGARSI